MTPAGCHGERTDPSVAASAKREARWPGSCPTRVASSDTVNPGGTTRGNTLGPPASTPWTWLNEELTRNA